MHSTEPSAGLHAGSPAAPPFSDGGKTSDVRVAPGGGLPKGHLVVMDRGYTDYRMFECWMHENAGFVTRLKDNADVCRKEEIPGKRDGRIPGDDVVEFNGIQAGRTMKARFRMVTVWLEEKGEQMRLLTSRFDLAVSTISEIYRERWRFGIFFKQLIQNPLNLHRRRGCLARYNRTWTAFRGAKWD